MPRISGAARIPVSIEVDMAKLYYTLCGSFQYKRLPSFPAAGLGEFGNVNPVIFDRDAISFTQKGDGNSCAARLAKGEYSIHSLTLERQFMEPTGDDTAITVLIRCHSQPKCEITSSRRKNGMLKAKAIPLGKFVGQMEFIRIELNNIPSHWKVRGATKGKTLAALKTQLEQLCLGYESTAPAEPIFGSEFRSILSEEDEALPSDVNETPSKSDSILTPMGHHLQPATSDNHPSSTVNSAVPMSVPQTPAILHQHTARKRKLVEMKAQYDEIEKEEDFMAKSREKKEKLWEDWGLAEI
ncbi:MAG: hypothetical protein Q9209_004844 [Squamulea sp. 1 TL-2023]